MKNKFWLALALLMIVPASRLPLKAASSRKGSTVEVTMTDGRMVKGELLAVKGHDLIIYVASRKSGFTVPIELVSAVKIKRSSQVLFGVAIGFIGGMGVGVAMAGSRSDGDLGERAGAAIMGLMCWGAATVIGGLTGAILSRPEEMATNGREPIQVNAYLRHLQKHARY